MVALFSFSSLLAFGFRFFFPPLFVCLLFYFELFCSFELLGLMKVFQKIIPGKRRKAHCFLHVVFWCTLDVERAEFWTRLSFFSSSVNIHLQGWGFLGTMSATPGYACTLAAASLPFSWISSFSFLNDSVLPLFSLPLCEKSFSFSFLQCLHNSSAAEMLRFWRKRSKCMPAPDWIIDGPISSIFCSFPFFCVSLVSHQRLLWWNSSPLLFESNMIRQSFWTVFALSCFVHVKLQRFFRFFFCVLCRFLDLLVSVWV